MGYESVCNPLNVGKAASNPAIARGPHIRHNSIAFVSLSKEEK